MGQFLKQTTASFIGSLAGLIFFFGLGAVGLLSLLIAVSATRSSAPQIEQDSILVFDLAAPISDARAPVGFGEIFTEDEAAAPLTLRQAIAAIDAAAEDRRISGLFIDGSQGNSSAGLASLKEIREALLRFQESGKPVLAYDIDGGERDFYLASVADTLALNPLGGLEFNGLSARQAFFAGALEKYGIGVQVVRAGRFKSAVEPFVRQELSPENREQLQALLADLWTEILTAIAARRETTPAQLQAIADDRGLLLPEEAEAAGLIDTVTHFDGVLDRLQEIANADADATSFPQISLQRYAATTDAAAKEEQSGAAIAVVYAEGNIVGGSDDLQAVSGDRYAKILRRLRQDEDIKAIVLRINSPGGSATASDVLLQEVLLAKEVKPVVVSMGDVAASGGYWIATGADSIFATPSTITGSIGVFGILTDIEGLGNENGVTWDGVKTGQLADLGTLTRPKTEAELARYQASVDRIYDLFLEKVAAARSLSKTRVDELAQGRVWSGVDAMDVGLVDRLGGLDDAVAHAAEMADLGDDWQVREYPRLQNFEERLLRRLTGEEETRLAQAPAEVRQLWQTWQALQEFGRQREVQARMPFSLVID